MLLLWLFMILIKILFLESLYSTVTFDTTDPGKGDSGSNPEIYKYYTRLTSYGIVPYRTEFITLQVKSCSNQFLMLSKSPDLISDMFYDIGLGVGAECNYIHFRKKVGITILKTYVPGLLDCSQWLTFWFSWKSGRIRVGKGDVFGVNTFLDWTDPEPIHVAGLGVMSAWGFSAQWLFQLYVSPSRGYSQCGSFGNRANMKLITQKKIIYTLGCPLACNLNINCMGYNVNNVTMECELVTAGQFIHATPDENWAFYIRCLEGMSSFALRDNIHTEQQCLL